MAWTTPKTWSSVGVTAAEFNLHLRDNLVFLRAVFDALTAGTTTDSGNTMKLQISHTSATDVGYSSLVVGDTQLRFRIDSDGRFSWGPGGAGAPDTNLYRSAATVLKTDGSLTFAAGGNILMMGGVLDIMEIASPAPPPTNTARLYVIDVAGKSRLAVVFATGASATIATEP